MARGLTKKQRGFVNSYADTGNATLAVRENYDVSDDNTAGVIGFENIRKPKIIKELKKLGFDSNNAKRVIGEILDDVTLEPKDRIKAAENIFKVHGDYAAEKHVNVTFEVKQTSDRLKRLADSLNET